MIDFSSLAAQELELERRQTIDELDSAQTRVTK